MLKVGDHTRSILRAVHNRVTGEYTRTRVRYSSHTRVARVSSMAQNEPLVSPEWVYERLSDSKVKILDATWYLPNQQKKGEEDFKCARITGAQFFDIDAVSDSNTNIPHMLPSEAGFAAAMEVLGINKDDTVVVYEKNGIAFAAARAWWMFRCFGHERVFVLDGGLGAWDEGSQPLDQSEIDDTILQSVRTAVQEAESKSNYSYPALLNKSLVVSKDDIINDLSSTKTYTIVDARGPGRFTGEEAEARPGVRSGHIPGSSNLPYSSFIEKGKLKREDDLKQLLGSNLAKSNVVASCGSGVTACVIALAFAKLGGEVAVYDGSWTEWGSDDSCPVESG